MLAVAALMLSVSLGGAQPSTWESQPSQPTPETQEKLRELVAAMPQNSPVRQMVEHGKHGDGVRQPWMDQMRGFGIKAAQVEVHMLWLFGPKALKPVRVVYYTDYASDTAQITDQARIIRIRAVGLEEELKEAALQLAPHSTWIDLPYPEGRPFRAATSVVLFDNEWLPSPPRLFTLFGPHESPLVAAVGNGDLADVDRLLGSRKTHVHELNQALFLACWRDNDLNHVLLARLLRAGADPNATNEGSEFRTPLMSAVWGEAPQLVSILIAAGAKINGAQGYADETPLTLAASEPNDATTIIEELLAAGADVKAANQYGLNALMNATHRQPIGVLELLITHGADVNARDHEGRTALMFAAERQNLEAVKVLAAAHADITARNKKGQTAMTIGTSRDIINFLKELGTPQ